MAPIIPDLRPAAQRGLSRRADGLPRILSALSVLLLLGACVPVFRPAAVTVGQTTIHLKSRECGRFWVTPAAVYCPPQEALDLHEAAHREQFRARGTAPMLVGYVARPSLRRRWEAEAEAVSLCVLSEKYPRPVLRVLMRESLKYIRQHGADPLEARALLAEAAMRTRCGSVEVILAGTEADAIQGRWSRDPMRLPPRRKIHLLPFIPPPVPLRLEPEVQFPPIEIEVP